MSVNSFRSYAVARRRGQGPAPAESAAGWRRGRPAAFQGGVRLGDHGRLPDRAAGEAFSTGAGRRGDGRRGDGGRGGGRGGHGTGGRLLLEFGRFGGRPLPRGAGSADLAVELPPRRVGHFAVGRGGFDAVFHQQIQAVFGPHVFEPVLLTPAAEHRPRDVGRRGIGGAFRTRSRGRRVGTFGKRVGSSAGLPLLQGAGLLFRIE